MNEDNYDNEDEDVIIEGSDLHKALTDVGITDFESIVVSRDDFNAKTDPGSNHINSNMLNFNFNCNCLEKIKNIYDTSWLYISPAGNISAIEQLQVILKLEPLLDDHAQEIQNICQNVSLKRFTLQWSTSLVLYSFIATSLMSKTLKIPGLITLSCSVMALAYRKYETYNSMKILESLVSVQNNIYYLYKKILRVLKNCYGIKMSQNSSPRRFSKFEVARLKYLQPMCEIFIQSMAKISYLYYKTSLHLIESSDNKIHSNLITKFDSNDKFSINGEITYENLKKSYYVYILIQSDMMMLLANIYRGKINIDNNHYTTYYTSSKSINVLLKYLKKCNANLNAIFEEYKSCSITPIQRVLRHKNNKWKDFHLHLNLLLRKIESTYGNISSIIDDIDDNYADCEETDEFYQKLMDKVNTIYKEINTAKNFAEFNTLLVTKYQRRKNNNDNGNFDIEFDTSNDIDTKHELPIVFDKDPIIVDEVFEEYIKEEYIKPLCENDDLDNWERIKLDKLLAKNFMSELKEVLIDKCRSMTERESKALLRSKKNHNVDKKLQNHDKNDEILIPIPPPLPRVRDNKCLLEFEEKPCKLPVPLPRTKKYEVALNDDDDDNDLSNLNLQKENIHHLDDDLVLDQNEMRQQLGVSMKMCGIRLPAFTVAEETFTGNGENSDEELMNNKNQDNIENVYQPSRCEAVIEELRQCCIKFRDKSLVCEGVDISKPYEHKTVDYRNAVR